MKKIKLKVIGYWALGIFFAIDAVLGWFVASYYFPKFPPSDDHLHMADRIVVEKALRKMTLYYKNEVVAMYDISLGFNPHGNKEKQGDGRTPEGKYNISHKNEKSKYHFSLQISYPNNQDILNARKKQVSVGGDIVIHGYPNAMPDWMGDMFLKNKDWTAGCIAVSNKEIEQIWSYVRLGTPIEILP